MNDLHPKLRKTLAFTDGVPDVSGLPCDALRTPAGEYMRRYYLRADQTIRFHYFTQSDPGTDLHDHPWDFVTMLVKGAYTEVTPRGVTRYEAPCVLTRKAEALHRIVLLDGPVWTYVVTGKVRRRWGFQTDAGWVHWRDHNDRLSVARC